jgi:hypothetical protein
MPMANESDVALQASYKSKPVDPTGTVGVNLKLPAGLHRKLRFKALGLSITLNDAITKAVAEWVEG